MRRKLIEKFLLLFSLLILTYLFQSCDDTVNTPQDYVGGTVTFIDTNLTYMNGFYAVSVYSELVNPYSHAPVQTDSLAITKSGNTVTAPYRVNGLAAGSYYVAATWILNSDRSVRAVLGIYGCDTARNCVGNKVTLPNYEGAGNCNIFSYTDTLKKLY